MPGQCEVKKFHQNVFVSCYIETCEMFIFYEHLIAEVSACSQHGKTKLKTKARERFPKRKIFIMCRITHGDSWRN